MMFTREDRETSEHKTMLTGYNDGNVKRFSKGGWVRGMGVVG